MASSVKYSIEKNAGLPPPRPFKHNLLSCLCADDCCSLLFCWKKKFISAQLVINGQEEAITKRNLSLSFKNSCCLSCFFSMGIEEEAEQLKFRSKREEIDYFLQECYSKLGIENNSFLVYICKLYFCSTCAVIQALRELEDANLQKTLVRSGPTRQTMYVREKELKNMVDIESDAKEKRILEMAKKKRIPEKEETVKKTEVIPPPPPYPFPENS